MFKLVALVFAALFAIAAARPGSLASSPVAYSSHYVQPLVSSHYSVPVVKTVVSPIVQSSVAHTPIVHSVAAPVVHAAPVVLAAPVVHSAPLVHSSPLIQHSYGAVPVVKSYSSAHGIIKN